MAMLLHLADRIAAERKSRNLSARQAADICRIEPDAYLMVEAGSPSVTLGQCLAVLEPFGLMQCLKALPIQSKSPTENLH